MKSHDPILKAVLALLTAGLCIGSALAKQPDIVILVADDMGHAEGVPTITEYLRKVGYHTAPAAQSHLGARKPDQMMKH